MDEINNINRVYYKRPTRVCESCAKENSCGKQTGWRLHEKYSSNNGRIDGKCNICGELRRLGFYYTWLEESDRHLFKARIDDNEEKSPNGKDYCICGFESDNIIHTIINNKDVGS